MLHVYNYSVYNNLTNKIIIIIILSVVVVVVVIIGKVDLFHGIVLVYILSSGLDSTWSKVSIKHNK